MIGAIASIAPALFGLMDNLFTSDEERAEAKRKLVEMEQAGELEKVKGQLAINMQEAKHESIFVAGWRPAVGWVCGAALAYTYIVQPFASFAAVVGGVDPATVQALPAIDMAVMMPALLGMLGLGGLRTVEKAKGVNKSR